MPAITSSGTYDKSTTGLEGLGATSAPRKFLFAGSTLGATCEVQYIDDAGTGRTLEGGQILDIPTSISVALNANLQVVVTGTPNFNLTLLNE